VHGSRLFRELEKSDMEEKGISIKHQPDDWPSQKTLGKREGPSSTQEKELVFGEMQKWGEKWGRKGRLHNKERTDSQTRTTFNPLLTHQQRKQ